jgi:hypothetical protein
MVWGINYQYSIEFVPILTIALFYLIWKLDIKEKQKIGLGIIGAVMAFLVTFNTLDHRVSVWYMPDQARFYQKNHFIRSFDVNKVKTVLDRIPKEVPVSAQSMLIPRLAYREKIYHYPLLFDAEYVAILLADENRYPYHSDEEYNKNYMQLKENGAWNVFYEDKDLLILKRK